MRRNTGIVVLGLALGAFSGCRVDDRKLSDTDAGTPSTLGSGRGGADGSSGRGPCGTPFDAKNCGVCGHDCTALANVTPGASGIECHAGTCFVPASACVNGFAHCSARPDDGCETNLADSLNCGACGVKCSGSTLLCSKTASGAKCSESCSAPTADHCANSCVDLLSDQKNCGTCGHDCTGLPNVAAGAAGIECRQGVCYVPPAACVNGFAHCSARPDDGCEASLADARTCGSCNTTCSGANPLCAGTSGASRCGSSCDSSVPNACGSLCVNLIGDPKNCGTCGHDCSALPNVRTGAAGITCLAGVCSVPPGACTSGFAHCSNRADDGCESDITRPDDCGQCNKKCTTPTALCSTATGSPSCSSSCVAPTPDLCSGKCVDVQTDPTNCSACGHDCTGLPHVKSGATGIECRSGVCFVPPSACASGFSHCSTRPDEGCETDLTLPANCGQCGRQCSAPTALCSATTGAPACSSSCTSPFPDLCGSQCVDKQSDRANCGACGSDCAALPNVRAGATSPAVQCVRGVCVLQPSACVSGFGHCSTNPNDGCETDLTRPATCGSCTTTCTAPLGLCSATSGVPTCSSSCTAPTPNLCGSSCVATATDPKNCGGCAHDCTALAHLSTGASGVQCSGGGCVIPQSSCASGFANCSTGSNDTDGCETPTTSLTNCGGCGVRCSLSNAAASCATGSCSLVSCNTGFADCDHVPSTGCEINTTNDSANCGGCLHACTGGMTCQASVCACPTGNTICSGQCADLQTDGNNCGRCGHSCGGGACTAGVCQPVVLAPGVNADRIAIDGTSVYWTDGLLSGTVAKVPIAGGAIVKLATGQNVPVGIAVDRNNVYWANSSGQSVMKVPLGGGTPTQIGTSMSPFHVVVDATSVYWTDAVAGTITKVPIAGGTAVPLVSGAFGVFGIALDATNVYWTRNDFTISKVPLAGGTPAILASSPDVNQPDMLTVDGTSVYWTNFPITAAPNTMGTVTKVSLTGGAVTTIATGQSGPSGIAVDATNVYWGQQNGGAIMRAPLAGGTVVTIATTTTDPTDVKVDANNVYWSDGNVMKLAK